MLVVDDKESGRAALVGMLAGEPYEIVEATDGFEALEKAIQLRPDVVLLDVMLPGLDGFEVCRRVRANLDANSIPIVMVTVLDDRESRLAGLDAGADDFISKPVSRLELRARVRTITRLNRHGRLQSAIDQLAAANQELRTAYDATLEGWVRLLDLRDHETEGHTARVTHHVVELAKRFDVGPADLVHLRRGALLHDIGKLGIPDSVLCKPGLLTPEERAIMEQHPRLAFEMLEPVAFLRPALDIPYCHHERWDGRGYPRGLSGTMIPHAARLFAIVDVWDALRHARPYKTAWSVEEARGLIVEGRGTQFEPDVVDAFLKMVDAAHGEGSSGTWL